ncbi:MAG: 6-phosphogluconolactonase [Acidobacteriota bacterium]
MAHVQVFADADALLDEAAEVVVRTAGESIGARGRFLLVLSGGSTPLGLYRRLASAACRDRIDWSRVHLFWGDERCVPPSHYSSNFGAARAALIDAVPVPPVQVHRMHGEDAPDSAATAYEAVLRATVGVSEFGGPGALDLVLLGLGTDGHTASLFPGMPSGRVITRWVVAEHVDTVRGWRITMTPPLLNAAHAVLFLVSGADKAGALSAVLEGPSRPSALPARRIAESGHHVRWLIDEPAAAQLTRTPPGS